MAKFDERFLFRGNAVALAGHIRRPNDLIIYSQASSVIPVTGGYARASVPAQKFGDVVEFKSAASDIAGDYQSPRKAVAFTRGNFADNRLPTQTTVKCSLDGLQVVNADQNTRHVLTCESVAAALISKHPRNGEPPSIKLANAETNGLAIDGFGLIVKFHTRLFSAYDTQKALIDAYEAPDDKFFGQYGGLFLFPPSTRGRRKAPVLGGRLYVSIVQSIKWADKPNPDATISGNRITVKDFGSIFIGEMFISSVSRRLTMMRFEIGSATGGDMSCVEIETNGATYPPL